MNHKIKTHLPLLLLSLILTPQCTSFNPALTQCAAGEECNSLIGVDDLADDALTLTETTLDQDCDDIDDSIDTDIGADVRVSYYTDSDTDGFGDASAVTLSCSTVDGAVTLSGDTDDTDATIFPGATEILADGIDQDGSGSDKYLVTLLSTTSSYQILTTYNSANEITQIAYDWDLNDSYSEYHFYTYDTNGNLTKEAINSDGSATYESYIEKTYDSLNRLTSEKTYSPNPYLPGMFYYTEEIVYTYDPDSLEYNQQTITTTPYTLDSSDYSEIPGTATSTTDCFAFESSEGVITAKYKDEDVCNGNYNFKYEYDSAGNNTAFYQDFDDDGDNEYLTVYTFTTQNKVASALQYAFDLSSETPWQAVYYTFDEFGTEATMGFDTDFDGDIDSTFITYTATYNE